MSLWLPESFFTPAGHEGNGEISHAPNKKTFDDVVPYLKI